MFHVRCSEVFQNKQSAGWWFGTCFIVPYIAKFIIPTDEVIFFRGVGIPPTSQSYHCYLTFFAHWCPTYVLGLVISQDEDPPDENAPPRGGQATKAYWLVVTGTMEFYDFGGSWMNTSILWLWTHHNLSGWWFGTGIKFFHILGMSSSQLTNSDFSEG